MAIARTLEYEVLAKQFYGTLDEYSLGLKASYRGFLTILVIFKCVTEHPDHSKPQAFGVLVSWSSCFKDFYDIIDDVAGITGDDGL
jgi:hypothetical protein